MTQESAARLAPIASALLVSDEAGAIEAFTSAMKALAVAVQVCPDPEQIRVILSERKVEAIVVDMRLGSASRSVVEYVRSSPSNNKIVILAIADPGSPRLTAHELGASFVFSPPCSVASIEPSLRAAYGMIVRERRRYFRAPISCAVSVTGPGNQSYPCRGLNVSEGGMALMTRPPLDVGDELQLQLTLPDSSIEISSSARVLWSDETGRAGVQFVSLLQQPSSLATLQGWLALQLEASLPQAVASKFRKLD